MILGQVLRDTFLDVLPEHFGLKTNQDITMVCSDQNKTVC